MNAGLARALVAGSSAAVLMLEILAGRLLAPYVGVSLETFTGIIGVVLAGIAVGAWAGGAIADQRDASKLIGSALAAGGALALLSLPILDGLGNQFGNGGVAIILLSLLSLFLPSAVLSAVSPMVAKLRLRDLDDTGAVVGGLSAAGTVGALAGTFLTGFVLVSTLPTRLTVILIGVLLILAGAACHGYFTRVMPSASAVVLIAASLVAGVSAGQPCDDETTYFCAEIVVDEEVASARSLYLDGLRHAYVDLEDPTNLDIRYIRLFARVSDAIDAGPLNSLHIGGGGMSFPRYLEEVRPGSTDLVLEIDGPLVQLVEDKLGLVQTEALQVQVGDARLAVAERADNEFDFAIGDAFASRSVPWHLTTLEFLDEVERVLAEDGIYVMNVIDGEDFGFARAELATLQQVFDYVQAIVPAEGIEDARSTNVILVGSDQPLPRFDIDPADGIILDEAETAAFVDGASALRDDFAPVDQLQD